MNKALCIVLIDKSLRTLSFSLIFTFLYLLDKILWQELFTHLKYIIFLIQKTIVFIEIKFIIKVTLTVNIFTEQNLLWRHNSLKCCCFFRLLYGFWKSFVLMKYLHVFSNNPDIHINSILKKLVNNYYYNAMISSL